jgi:hypothetical protein
VINRAFADRLLAGDDPLGKRFRTQPEGEPIETIGVAEDGKYFSLSESRMPVYWSPLETWYSPTASLVARTGLGATEALDSIRKTVGKIDPSLALHGTGTMQQQLDLPLFPARLAASALGSFWNLWRDGVRGGAEDTGDRDSDGGRREPEPDPGNGTASCGVDDRVRRVGGIGRGDGIRAAAEPIALRDRFGRSVHLGNCVGADGRSGGGGVLAAGATCDRDRPNASAAGRLAGRKAAGEGVEVGYDLRPAISDGGYGGWY